MCKENKIVQVTLSTTPLIAELQNALAATSMMHGGVSYAAHHHTRTYGFKAFTQEKCIWYISRKEGFVLKKMHMV